MVSASSKPALRRLLRSLSVTRPCSVATRRAKRSAAAILLSDAPVRGDQSTLRQRVFLAHELCHLLFDVTHDEAITISADADIEQKSNVAVRGQAVVAAVELGHRQRQRLAQLGIEHALGQRAAQREVALQGGSRAAEQLHHVGYDAQLLVNGCQQGL